MSSSTKHLALLACAVAASTTCRSERASLVGPSALILDANNNSGNPFFVWLQPIRQQAPPAGQLLSTQVRPTITISNLCTGAVIRTFSGAQVQVNDERYRANWRTSDDNLDPDCHYRIAVSAGARQLGVADVDVVDEGRDLKLVNTDEYIPLLEDRTLPIKFFIGVGSQCERADSDCGEGMAHPDAATTIVTAHGRAGVFIPAGAVDQPVMVIIESSDTRPCIVGLLEPVFPGQIGALGNSCYDFHTEPPLSEINALGKFNTKVTVGICAETGDLDHVTRDLLQIFQFHAGAVPEIFGLNNARASFLSCDAKHASELGSSNSWLRSVVKGITAPFIPKPLHAHAWVMLDAGAGGETDMFSRFTWALPSLLELNFDQGPELQSILPGATLNSLYARLGVTFSRTNPLGLCPGSAVYANDYGLLGFGSGQNNISPCPLGIASDFSQLLFGAVKASFAVPAAESCITATPTGFHNLFPGGVAYIEALDGGGNVIDRAESTTQRVAQRLCVQGTGIRAVRFAGKGAAFAIFDNLSWAR